MVPSVLWCIRESKNATLAVSQFMMLMERNPSNPFKLIKDSWSGENELPQPCDKSVADYLTDLKANLKNIHDFAGAHAEQEQQKYVDH